MAEGEADETEGGVDLWTLNMLCAPAMFLVSTVSCETNRLI